MEAARKLVGGAIGLVAAAASHAVWYVRYHVEGVTRDHPGDARKPDSTGSAAAPDGR